MPSSHRLPSGYCLSNADKNVSIITENSVEIQWSEVLDSTFFFFFGWEVQEKCHRFYILKIICCAVRYQGDMQCLSHLIWDVAVELCSGSCSVSSVDPPWNCSRVFQLLGRSFLANSAWGSYCMMATAWCFLVLPCLKCLLSWHSCKELAFHHWLPEVQLVREWQEKCLTLFLSFQTTAMNWWPSNLQR